jgi:hypothetical protein
MTFDNFDAALLAATPLLLPAAGASEAMESDSGPTLDAALREFEGAERASSVDHTAGDEAADEPAAPDLWVTDAMRSAARPVAVDEADANDGGSTERSGKEGLGGPEPQEHADAPQDHPLIRNKLTLLEHPVGGNAFDSTEWVFNEMSTGDWEWAVRSLRDQAQWDIQDIINESQDKEEARQRVFEYLSQHGFNNPTQVFGSATYGNDGAIPVYGHPAPPPPLLLNFDQMGGWDAQGAYNGSGSAPGVSTDPIADTNPDGPDVGIEVLDEAYRARVEASAARLRAGIEVLDAKFNALGNTQTFMLKNGTAVTGAEVKALWDAFDFRVTDRFFPIGAGAVVNGVSNIRWDAVDGWNAWDPNGLTFIILHEFVHGSPLGTMSSDVMYAFHELFGGNSATYNEYNFWFDANEEFANWGARELMIRLSIPVPASTPPFGWNDTMPASPLFSPPPPPPFDPGGSGGGGGEVNGN